uniref:Putative secreted protein n=1 Tax=Ixodes ricinus TaxID=34613 RepID=A0A6B0U1C1_IXORI
MTWGAASLAFLVVLPQNSEAEIGFLQIHRGASEIWPHGAQVGLIGWSRAYARGTTGCRLQPTSSTRVETVGEEERRIRRDVKTPSSDWND